MGHFSKLNQENKELKIYRPFGPSIGHCKLPQELIDDFNKDCDDIVGDKEKSKLHDFSDDLVGNVKQELTISSEVFEKWVPYFQKLVNTYIGSHPDNAKEMSSIKQMIFKSGWYVRSFQGDFNPAHFHTNCHMSCVGYLSLPKGIQKEWDREDKDGKKDLLKAIHFIEMIIERDYKEIKQESWVEGFRKWKRGTL